MSKKFYFVVMLIFMVVITCSAQTKFGIKGAMIMPLYYGTLMQGKNANGGLLNFFYQITELYGFEITGELNQSRSKLYYTFSDPVEYDTEIELNNTAIVLGARHDFIPDFSKSYYYHVRGEISLNSLSSTILTDGIKRSKSELPATVQPYSYDGKFIPAIYIGGGVEQPVIFNIELFVELGFNILLASGDILPEKKGTLVYPQIMLGMRFVNSKW